MRGLSFSVLVTALLTGVVGVTGCQSCKNDHPYVPPAPDGGLVLATDAGTALSGGDAGAEPALALAAGTTSWKGDGLAIEAGSQEIALVLARDFDGDGKKDALAILRKFRAVLLKTRFRAPRA